MSTLKKYNHILIWHRFVENGEFKMFRPFEIDDFYFYINGRVYYQYNRKVEPTVYEPDNDYWVEVTDKSVFISISSYIVSNYNPFCIKALKLKDII